MAKKTQHNPLCASPNCINPYELVLVGKDAHPGIAADSKDDYDRKLYVQLWDERVNLPLDKDSIDGTLENGVDVPVLVIEYQGKLPEYQGKLFVVDGRRRTLYSRVARDMQEADKVAEKERITVPIRHFTGSLDDAFARSRAANVTEQSSPLMKARDMQRLLDMEVPNGEGGKRKRSVQEVASIYRCSDQHVRDMLKLFKSSDTVKKALTELPATVGLIIADLDETQQQAVLAELGEKRKSGQKVTTADAKASKARQQGKQSATAKDKLESLERSCTKLCAAADPTKDDLLRFVDAVNRTMYLGKVKFPEPIKDQKPGYTLAILAGL